MLSKILNLTFFILLTGLLWFLDRNYANPVLEKWYYTAVSFTIIYFVFRFILEEVSSKRISDARSKYSFRKTVGILFWIVFTIIFIRIWIKNPQALLVAYGLVAAGVAVSMQDFFKNFIGGITLFTRGLYRVGDRIEINGEFGDVIDVGLMYTTIMEMKEWIDGDQATGRICTVPNGNIISYVVNNYTKDHNFIWDEIKVPITYESDWKLARDKILEIVKKETKNMSKQAEAEISKIKKKYYITNRDVDPRIYMAMTDNWITFNIRYVTEVRKRRELHNILTQKILDEIQKSKNIHVASATLKLVDRPKKRNY